MTLFKIDLFQASLHSAALFEIALLSAVYMPQPAGGVVGAIALAGLAVSSIGILVG